MTLHVSQLGRCWAKTPPRWLRPCEPWLAQSKPPVFRPSEPRCGRFHRCPGPTLSTASCRLPPARPVRFVPRNHTAARPHVVLGGSLRRPAPRSFGAHADSEGAEAHVLTRRHAGGRDWWVAASERRSHDSEPQGPATRPSSVRASEVEPGGHRGLDDKVLEIGEEPHTTRRGKEAPPSNLLGPLSNVLSTWSKGPHGVPTCCTSCRPGPRMLA